MMYSTFREKFRQLILSYHANADDTRRLLLRTFVAQPGCGTSVARLSWTVAELRNKLRNPNLNSNLL